MAEENKELPALELEQTTVQIPMDESYQGRLKGFESDGWGVTPGTVPIVTFHLVRIKPGSLGIKGVLKFDETKIGIHKSGTPEDQIEWGGATLNDYAEKKL